MMKQVKALTADGLKLKAMSQNGNGEVASYIAIRRGRRVYGRYDHKLNRYIEELAPKH